jgi:hypothetical protein
MVHGDALIVDYGPKFLGHVFRADKRIVCVVPRQLQAGDVDSSAMREMVREVGGDCGGCRNCPLGSGG